MRLPRLGKYAVVGTGNTVLSAALFAALHRQGVSAVAAGALAFAAGACNGYVWNRWWTFGAPDSRTARFRYLAVQAGGLATTSAGIALLAPAFGAGAGYAAVLPSVTLGTYAINRTWTFKVQPWRQPAKR